MFYFNLKLFLRNILKQRIYSVINVLGLSVGISLFLLISLFVIHEYNYDRDNPAYHAIERLEIGGWSVLPAGVSHILNGQIPEIKRFSRTQVTGKTLLTYQADTTSDVRSDISLEYGLFVDSTFLEMFNFKMIYGNPRTAMAEDYNCVITESTAKKLFGDENPLNKIISVDNVYTFTISGVVEDPIHSHFVFEFLIPLTCLNDIVRQDYLEDLNRWNYLTYFECYEPYNRTDVGDKIFEFLQKNEEMQAVDDSSSRDICYLRPLKDIYFAREARFEAGAKHGNRQLVNSFVSVAIFILVIAGINFINLTTARATLRAKEVGIRKVVGSLKRNLILQFLLESIFLSIISMVLALTFLQILLPEFNNLADTYLSFERLWSPMGIITLLLISLFIGFVSGLYPAFFLSHYKPINVLKGSIQKGRGSSLFRKVLISVQFVIAAVLISGTFVVYEQTKYVKNKDLGFKKDNIVNITLEGALRRENTGFKEKLLANPNIEAVSFSHGIPGSTNNTMTFPWKDDPVQMRITSADPEFFDLYDIRLKEGRLFNREMETDKLNTVVINETAAKIIGWDDPVGQVVNSNVNSRNFINPTFTVIGVIEDYHIESLHTKVVPMAIAWDDRTHWQGSIKLSGENIRETIRYIEETWNEFNPNFPFVYRFLDQQFDQMYKSEERLLKNAMYFSILAIMIACLGLFGLSAYMTSIRTKEIGIRKVLGSGVSSIISKFSKEYSLLVLISNMLAAPIAYFVMDFWLHDYPYQINIPIWVFFVSFIITMIIALATVSFHSYKAAIKNPVDAIKYE